MVCSATLSFKSHNVSNHVVSTIISECFTGFFLFWIIACTLRTILHSKDFFLKKNTHLESKKKKKINKRKVPANKTWLQGCYCYFSIWKMEGFNIFHILNLPKILELLHHPKPYFFPQSFVSYRVSNPFLNSCCHSFLATIPIIKVIAIMEQKLLNVQKKGGKIQRTWSSLP